MALDQKLIARLDELSRAMPQEAEVFFEETLHRVAEKMQLIVEQTEAQRDLEKIPLYNERSDRAETAIEFFHRNYDDVLRSTSIYADDLRRHDPRLYGALAVHLTERGEGMRSLLPVRPRSITAGQRYGGDRKTLTLRAS